MYYVKPPSWASYAFCRLPWWNILENGENKKYRSNYFLTESGKDIMDQLDGKIKAAVSGGGTGLSDEEREVFYRCLTKIVTNLEEVSKSFSTMEDE